MNTPACTSEQGSMRPDHAAIARRDPLGRWQKGASANPSGRTPVLREVADLARKHTALAIATLAEIAANAKAPTASRVAAAGLLLERAWGRAPQAIHLTSETDARVLHLEAVRALAAMPGPNSRQA